MFSLSNETLFKQELSDTNWDQLFSSNDINFQYNYFSDTLNEKYDKHFPLKKCKVKPSSVMRPRITGGILKSVKRKNRLYYKQKIKNPTETNIRRYTESIEIASTI